MCVWKWFHQHRKKKFECQKCVHDTTLDGSILINSTWVEVLPKYTPLASPSRTVWHQTERPITACTERDKHPEDHLDLKDMKRTRTHSETLGDHLRSDVFAECLSRHSRTVSGLPRTTIGCLKISKYIIGPGNTSFSATFSDAQSAADTYHRSPVIWRRVATVFLCACRGYCQCKAIHLDRVVMISLEPANSKKVASVQRET